MNSWANHGTWLAFIRSMKTFIILMGFLSSLLVMAPTSGLADGPNKTGPHGGVLLGNDSQQVELSIDPAHSSADVYVIKGQKQFPDSIGLTVLDAVGNRRVFELKALESNAASSPQFHGSLDASQQSYVGFEIRIPFTTEPPATLKSN